MGDPRTRPRRGRSTRPADPVRRLVFDVLRSVTGEGAYANIALSQALRQQALTGLDAAFATELTLGTCRYLGTYDRIIVAAGGRRLSTLQPALVDILRLGAHQVLSTDIPPHAAVATTVDLARDRIGERVTGLVNAVLRKVTAKTLSGWTAELSQGEDELTGMATRFHHPGWIVRAYADLLPIEEVEAVLQANNAPASPTLVTRPGLSTLEDLVALGAVPCDYSPYGASFRGAPGSLAEVRAGTVGVQDEGSQLVALALARAAARSRDADEGGSEGSRPALEAWLDLCAGPGGKSALLRGLASDRHALLLSNEVVPHRARLVRQALAAYGEPRLVVCGDGANPPWKPATFRAVLADVPCTGLGALRRRPESRWTRSPGALQELVPLQRRLLASALRAAQPGGVVAYVTCSPHREETTGVVDTVLADSPGVRRLPVAEYLPEIGVAAGTDLQLWPHRHGTDAMFCALLTVDR